MKKIGFIGCGNMGEAILAGALKANAIKAEDIYVSTADSKALERIQQTYGVHICTNNTEVYQQSDYIIFAIKPNIFELVMQRLKPFYDKQKVIVSIAAGITFEKLAFYFGQSDIKAIRVMPNTPALVNEGASAICYNAFIDETEVGVIKAMFEAIGLVEEIDEANMDAVVATSGSSPAYVFMLLDAMIQEGVRLGLAEDVAKKLAAQSVLGAAKMVLTSDKSPDELKTNVCSPNGTTLEAVSVLERERFQSIVAKAMDACAAKSKKMSE